MSGPPPPPYSASWQIYGSQNDIQKWAIGWHLSLPSAVAFDFASVRALHEDLLLWSEPYFGAILADATVCDLSRLQVTGPASSVGDELYLFSRGTRGSPVPAAVAVCVRELVQAVGRGRAGRFFLPAPSTFDVEFGFQLKPAARSDYQASTAALFNGVNAISTPSFPSVRFAVIHRRENGAYIDPAIIEPVDQMVLSRRLATQDRRMSSTHTH